MIIFSINQFFAESGFNALVFKKQSGQFDADQCKQSSSKDGPNQSCKKQGMWNFADKWQFGHVAGKPPEYWQECEQSGPTQRVRIAEN